MSKGISYLKNKLSSKQVRICRYQDSNFIIDVMVINSNNQIRVLKFDK